MMNFMDNFYRYFNFVIIKENCLYQNIINNLYSGKTSLNFYFIIITIVYQYNN